jgi:hypothetical protein
MSYWNAFSGLGVKVIQNTEIIYGNFELGYSVNAYI